MAGIRLLAAAAALLLSGTAPAQPAEQTNATAPDYSQDSAWLCLPGRTDACSRPLATTPLNPNGYGSTGQVVPAKDPPVDCFYIYPTVSRDAGLNSDMAAGPEETGTAEIQFARFGTVCRTFAPIYRQATLTALRVSMTGGDVGAAFALAHDDVLAAWKEFLAHRSNGRPFVLIGHSQGSVHLEGLIAEEIDGKPIASRMVSALLLGWSVDVPPGKVVGGSFKSVPLCTRGDQTGCVVTYMSFRASSPPPAGSFLGRATEPGMTAGCTNPAELAGDGSHLDSYWYAPNRNRPGEEAVAWSSQGAAPTPYLRTEGLVSARCAHDGQAGYLAISVNADPSDARTDRIPGDVYMLGQINPGWGLHLVDMNIAQGNLIRLVEQQTAAWQRRR